jgi:hypothetical protein
MAIGSSALPVDRARFPFGVGGSWFAGRSYLAQNHYPSRVLLGESMCPLKRQSIDLGAIAGMDCTTLCTPGRTLWSLQPSLTRLGIEYYSDVMYIILLLGQHLLIPSFKLQKKFPGSMLHYQMVVGELTMCFTDFYSTLAGFIEPAETFEEAVAREIYEESGIHLTNITYHSCQPWVGTLTDPMAPSLIRSI